MIPDARLVPGKVGQLDAAYLLAGDDVAAKLEIELEAGLKADQVVWRARQHGPNLLPDAPPRSPWLVFASQFKSILILILILIGAAGLAALIGNTKDALVIVAVVLINATVGFYQEYRAEQSLAALKSMRLRAGWGNPRGQQRVGASRSETAAAGAGRLQ